MYEEMTFEYIMSQMMEDFNSRPHEEVDSNFKQIFCLKSNYICYYSQHKTF